MSNTVQPRFHRPLPGGGRDSNGNPRQGKVEVRGKVTVTSALGTGEDLTAADLGLKTIDWIDLKVDESIGAASGAKPRTAHYVFSAQQFYVLEDDSAALTSGNNYTLSYNAFGDTARDAELL